MTGREMLRMFARLRGIPGGLLEEVVTASVDQLNLGKWADKMCGDYRYVAMIVMQLLINFFQENNENNVHPLHMNIRLAWMSFIFS